MSVLEWENFRALSSKASWRKYFFVLRRTAKPILLPLTSFYYHWAIISAPSTSKPSLLVSLASCFMYSKAGIIHACLLEHTKYLSIHIWQAYCTTATDTFKKWFLTMCIFTCNKWLEQYRWLFNTFHLIVPWNAAALGVKHSSHCKYKGVASDRGRESYS